MCNRRRARISGFVPWKESVSKEANLTSSTRMCVVRDEYNAGK